MKEEKYNGQRRYSKKQVLSYLQRWFDVYNDSAMDFAERHRGDESRAMLEHMKWHQGRVVGIQAILERLREVEDLS